MLRILFYVTSSRAFQIALCRTRNGFRGYQIALRVLLGQNYHRLVAATYSSANSHYFQIALLALQVKRIAHTQQPLRGLFRAGFAFPYGTNARRAAVRAGTGADTLQRGLRQPGPELD